MVLRIDAHGYLDRGYLTTIEELEFFARQARWGVEPYATLNEEYFSDLADAEDWEHGEAAGNYYSKDNFCFSDETDHPDRFINQQGGGHAVYEKMLAYHLTHEIDYAIITREKILEVTRSYGFGGEVYNGSNECIRHLAFAIPLWVQAADLLEGEPIWKPEDKLAFQDWLIDEVYRKVAWASRAQRNNWGSAGSVATSIIADYLSDRTDILLVEYEPQALSLTPPASYLEHNAIQIQRMNTQWQGDSRCDRYGIQEYGGIPDELRRGDAGCDALFLEVPDDSYMYQITHIDHLVFHAEYLRRRGNLSIYNNLETTGGGSLLNSILFIIENPESEDKIEWDAYKTGILYVANAYYQDQRLQKALYTDSIERGGMVALGQITHPLLEAPEK